MMHISPLYMAWLRALQRPFWTSLFVLVVVASVLLTGQALGRAPLVPDLNGVVMVWLGLVPEMVGILAPVALLFAGVSAARMWTEGGELRGLMASGLGPSRLIPVSVCVGLVVAIGVALCTHWLAPMGRTSARQVISGALSSADLRAKAPLSLGSIWMRVEDSRQGELSGVVVATDQWVGWAEKGRISDSVLYLEDGMAKPIDESWTLKYAAAQVPLTLDGVGVHNFDRTSLDLMARIRDKASQKISNTREKITLHKRTTLALGAPLFLLLGIPFGIAFRRPAWATLGVVFAVWGAQRLADHFAVLVGAEIAAAAPLVLMLGALSYAWTRFGRTL